MTSLKNKGNFFPKWLFKKHVHFGIGSRENNYHLFRNSVAVPPVLAWHLRDPSGFPQVQLYVLHSETEAVR